MGLLTIDQIIGKNEFILLDKSSLFFSFEYSYPEGIKEKILERESKLKTGNYWKFVFDKYSDSFKFYIPKKAVGEFYFRNCFNYKKEIKKANGGDFVKFARLIKKENSLFNYLKSFFTEENIISLDKEQKEVYYDILQGSKKRISRINKNLSVHGKSKLSKVDIDYFLTTAVLNSYDKSSSLITNDFGLFYLAGNFVLTHEDFNFGVYIHQSLGKFREFEQGKKLKSF